MRTAAGRAPRPSSACSHPSPAARCAPRSYPLLPGRTDEDQLHALLTLMRDALRWSAASALGKHIMTLPFGSGALAPPDSPAAALLRAFSAPATQRLTALVGEGRAAEPGFADALNLAMACRASRAAKASTRAAHYKHLV